MSDRDTPATSLGDRYRILWLKAGKLLPVDTGGKLRSYHLAKQLAARHELTMFTYYDGPVDASYAEHMEVEFPGAVTLATRVTEGRGAAMLRYLNRLPSAMPFAVGKYDVRAVRRRIREWSRHGRFDVMICDFLAATPNFRGVRRTPTVLFQHNVESSLWRRRATHAPHPLARPFYALEAAKMDRYERVTVQRFDHIVAVSDHDRELMAAYTDPSRITVVPTGVDTAQFRPARTHRASSPLVLFLGSMDWEPNVDGVEWMVETMWPQIAAAVPNATCRIVGRNPGPRVRRLASDAIEVTGTVPSVIEHLAQAAVVVVPLRVGGGTRLKIFEAMAAGRAVVSTSIGAEGLQVAHGRDLLLADTPDAFAQAVIDVLRDDDLRERLGRGAAEVSDRHDWRAVAQHLERALQRVVVASPFPAMQEPVPPARRVPAGTV